MCAVGDGRRGRAIAGYQDATEFQHQIFCNLFFFFFFFFLQTFWQVFPLDFRLAYKMGISKRKKNEAKFRWKLGTAFCTVGKEAM